MQGFMKIGAGPDFRKSLILKGLWHVVNHETRAQKNPPRRVGMNII
jgi:hypothetical protein